MVDRYHVVHEEQHQKPNNDDGHDWYDEAPSRAFTATVGKRSCIALTTHSTVYGQHDVQPKNEPKIHAVRVLHFVKRYIVSFIYECRTTISCCDI